MTVADHPTDTRHLVDPELAPALDAFPPFVFDEETLPLIRAGMSQLAQGAVDPAESYPDVARQERHVPGAPGDPEVRVLCYEKVGRSSPTAALLWIHGGGYVLGTADADDLTCRQLASETGAVVVSVDYRLAPETPAPGPLNDCYAALAWAYGAATELGLDPTRFLVGGASAGGGLAACLSLLARDRGDIPISLQVLIYPMLDDRTASTVQPHPYAGEFIWKPSDNRFGWAALLGGQPGGDDVSPYVAAARVPTTAGLPATFISVGSLDLFAEEDIAYATRLIREGVLVELHVYPGAYHGFNMVPFARLTQAYVRDYLDAINRHLDQRQEA